MEGNVVQTFQSGETKVIICDDYCRDKTEEDVRKILKEITRQTKRHLQTKSA